MKRLPAVIAVLTATLLATSDVRGQESKAPPPEMKILQKMVGQWREETVSKVAEWTPQETRMKTTLKATPILGGRFVSYRVSDNEGKVLALIIRTFDAEQRVYREWLFHVSGNVIEARGLWDEATKTLTLTDVGQRIKGVATIRFVDNDTMEWIFVSKDPQGRTYLDIEGKSTRQK